MMTLQDKKILVVGNNLNFQKEISIELSNLGATTILINQNKEWKNEILSYSSEENYRYYHLLNIQNIQKTIDDIISKEGYIDAYIHCSDEMRNNLSSIEYTNLRVIFDKNIASYLAFISAISLRKQNNKYLPVVYISSDLNKLSAAYMSKTLALELYDQNIRINSILFENTYKYELNENNNDFIKKVSLMSAYLISENANFIVGEVYKIN